MARIFKFFAWIICWGVFSYAQADETDKLRQAVLGYIESIQTLEADFAEKGEGRSATGTIFLKRPAPGDNTFGKLKCAYKPPSPLEIVSYGGDIYMANHQAKTLDSTPLSSTPLFVLLRAKINLGDTVVEKELKDEGDLICWTLTQAEDTGGENPELTLKFTKAPLALDGWILHDLAGSVTEVQLSSVKIGNPLSEDLFKKPVIAEE